MRITFVSEEPGIRSDDVSEVPNFIHLDDIGLSAVWVLLPLLLFSFFMNNN
jgi:hypothetical protein